MKVDHKIYGLIGHPVEHSLSPAMHNAAFTELGIDAGRENRLIEVWNKIDRLDADARVRLFNQADRQPDGRRPVLLSALTGEGIERLTAAIETRIGEGRVTLNLLLDPADGAGMSWLHRHTEVLSKEMRGAHLAVTARMDAAKAEQTRAKFGAAACKPVIIRESG